MAIRTLGLVPLLLVLSGCMTLTEGPSAFSPCPVEQAWDASLAALSDFPIQKFDKAAGALETNWVEVAASMPAGIIQRDVNKERLKYMVEVKPDGRGAVTTVMQIREEWSPMGVRMLQWRAMPGNAREAFAVADEIARRLKEKGC